MRPYDFYEIDQLRLAHDHAEELRAAWQTANFGKASDRPAAATAAASVGRAARLARSAAGRALIGIGQRMLPAETGPCT